MTGENVAVKPQALGETGLPRLQPEDVAPVFRAVAGPSERRGIRLERAYWSTLRMMAGAVGATLGEVVEEIANAHAGSANLASLLRVSSLSWLSARLERYEAMLSTENLQSLVLASPSPAFVLTADKRIAHYNQAFIALIQSRFQSVDAQMMAKGLRMTLDTPVEQVIGELEATRNKPMTSGFALGMADQRLRGQVSIMLAPSAGRPMLIAYIARY